MHSFHFFLKQRGCVLKGVFDCSLHNACYFKTWSMCPIPAATLKNILAFFLPGSLLGAASPIWRVHSVSDCRLLHHVSIVIKYCWSWTWNKPNGRPSCSHCRHKVTQPREAYIRGAGPARRKPGLLGWILFLWDLSVCFRWTRSQALNIFLISFASGHKTLGCHLCFGVCYCCSPQPPPHTFS